MRESSNHTPRSRDAALRRLASSNRWLIAGSTVLTGIFTAVAANAFPGHTVKTGSTAGARSEASKARRTRALSKPAQAPESSEGAEEGFESTEASSSEEGHSEVPAEESSGSEASSGAEESSGSEESVESTEPRSTEVEAAREPEVEAPVVSGGS